METNLSNSGGLNKDTGIIKFRREINLIVKSTSTKNKEKILKTKKQSSYKFEVYENLQLKKSNLKSANMYPEIKINQRLTWDRY